MEEKELKRINIKKFASISGLFGAIFGLILGSIYGTVVIITGPPIGGFPARIVGISGILGGLILGGVIGFLSGGVIALLYNFIADKIGGLKFEFD